MSKIHKVFFMNGKYSYRRKIDIVTLKEFKCCDACGFMYGPLSEIVRETKFKKEISTRYLCEQCFYILEDLIVK